MENETLESNEQENPGNGMSPEETPEPEETRDFVAEQMEQMESMVEMSSAIVAEAIEGRDIAKEKREFRDRCILDVWITLLNMGADPTTIYEKTAAVTGKLVAVREELEGIERAYMKKKAISEEE